MNFLGILKDGLKIAPPEAPTTGYLLGKGIYFSDAFAKSKMYVSGNKKIILLCEVAMGTVQRIQTPEQHRELDLKTVKVNTLIGEGVNVPNSRLDVVIPNGMIMPMGDIEVKEHGSKPFLWNEFCVFSETQVKMRYMVVF